MDYPQFRPKVQTAGLRFIRLGPTKLLRLPPPKEKKSSLYILLIGLSPAQSWSGLFIWFWTDPLIRPDTDPTRFCTQIQFSTLSTLSDVSVLLSIYPAPFSQASNPSPMASALGPAAFSAPSRISVPSRAQTLTLASPPFVSLPKPRLFSCLTDSSPRASILSRKWKLFASSEESTPAPTEVQMPEPVEAQIEASTAGEAAKGEDVFAVVMVS